MVVSFPSNANSVIVGDSSNGMGYIYHRGCPAGRKSSSVGCVGCTSGTYSFAAADACTDCAAGTYSEDKAIQCTTCAAGKVATLLPPRSAPFAILAEYSLSQPTAKREKGKYSTGGWGVRLTAKPANFPTLLAHPTARTATEGSIRRTGGWWSAFHVQQGRSAVTWACQRARLDSGYSPSPGRWECLPCKAGTFEQHRHRRCMSCRRGTYSKRQASTCLLLPG